MRRAGHGIILGLAALTLAVPAGDAQAGERWELDPATGDWLLIETSEETPAEARREDGRARRERGGRPGDDLEDDRADARSDRADLDAPPANPRPPVRSGGAIAGGIVLTSVGALFAGLGGFALLYNSATQADPEEYVAPVAVTALGLGAVGGGITLMVWGGRRDEPSYGVQVAPTRVQLGGTF